MRSSLAAAFLLSLLGCKPRPIVCEPLAYTTASGATVPPGEIQSRPCSVTFHGSENAVVDWVSFGHVYTSNSTSKTEGSFSVTRDREAVTVVFQSPRCIDSTAHGGFCTKYSQDEQTFTAHMECGPMPLGQFLRE